MWEAKVEGLEQWELKRASCRFVPHPALPVSLTDSADVEKLSLNGGRKLVVVRMPSPSKTGKASQFAINGMTNFDCSALLVCQCRWRGFLLAPTCCVDSHTHLSLSSHAMPADALVGQVTKKVAELTNNKYVAVWTAEKPSEGCNMVCRCGGLGGGSGGGGMSAERRG